MMEQSYPIMSGYGHTESECNLIRALDRRDIRTLGSRGLRLEISHNFSALKSVNASLRSENEDCKPLVPFHDPDCEPISRYNGVWACVRGRDHRVFAIAAARMRQVSDLSRALSDGSFLFGPSPPADAICDAAIPHIDGIAGPVIFVGSLFVAPECRGTGLSRLIVGAVSRAAWFVWSPVHILAFTEHNNHCDGGRFESTWPSAGEVLFRDPRWGQGMYRVISIGAQQYRRMLCEQFEGAAA